MVRLNPDVYLRGTPLFLDFETTNLDKGSALNPNNRLVLACWQLGWTGEIQSKWGTEFEQAELLQAVEDADYIVAHNAKFELQWLVRCGVDLQDVTTYDTMIGEYVIGGNRWQMGVLSLDRIAQRRGIGGKEGLVSTMIKSGVPTEDIPAQWLEKYCRKDVQLLPEIMAQQINEMDGTRLMPVAYARNLLTPVLADLENEGMKLDEDLVRTRITEVSRVFDDLSRKLNAMTGGINLNSPKQLGVYLYETLEFPEKRQKRRGRWEPMRSATGNRLTGAAVVSDLRATTSAQKKFQALFREHRDVYSELTKYLRKFEACLDEAGGVLDAQFNQCTTQTHRLSSSGRKYSTQFQNLPRKYKGLFMAKREGHLMAEADGAQLEFRVAAHLGRDEQAIADIREGVDVHAFTAKVLTDAGQKTDRQGAKEHTFKPLYGGQSGTNAEQTYYRAFKEQYKGIANTQGKWINAVLMDKSLETEWGLRYYWPDTKMDRSGYIKNTTSICNYPVQAFATAEIIPLVIVSLWHKLQADPDPGIYLVNTVHDSIIAEVREDCVEKFHELVRTSFIEDVKDLVKELYGVEIVAPMGCGVKIGPRWGAGDEVQYEEWTNDTSNSNSDEDECDGATGPEGSVHGVLIPVRSGRGVDRSGLPEATIH